MDAIEQREMRQAFAPRDLEQLVRALNRLRAGNRIYARLSYARAAPSSAASTCPRCPARCSRC